MSRDPFCLVVPSFKANERSNSNLLHGELALPTRLAITERRRHMVGYTYLTLQIKVVGSCSRSLPYLTLPVPPHLAHKAAPNLDLVGGKAQGSLGAF